MPSYRNQTTTPEHDNTAIRRLRATALILLGLACAPSAFAQPVPVNNYQQHSDHAGQENADGQIVFKGHAITIPVIAVEPGRPDTRFEVHGKINPTLVVPANTRIRITIANMDGGMAHGLDITRQSPPYATTTDMPLDAAGESHDKSPDVIAVTGIAPPYQTNQSDLTTKSTGWFRLKPGHYYYVCPVPDHAHKGMYGQIIAR